MKKIMVVLFVILFSGQAFSFKIPDSLKKAVPKPTAKLKKVTIESISLRDINFLFHIQVYNPYPVKLNLKKIGFTFFVEGKQFFRTATAKSFKVGPKKRRTNVFRVNLKYADIINIVRDYKNKEYLKCQSKVFLQLWLPDMVKRTLGDSIGFTFRHKSTLPAVKPKINVANFKVKMPSMSDIRRQLAIKRSNVSSKKVSKMFSDIFSGKSAKRVIDPASLDLPIKVNFDIKLKNEARAKLLFRNLKYDFYVGNDKLIGGLTKKIVRRGNVSVISIGNTFSSKNMSKSIYKLFRKGKGDFKVKGVTKLQMPKKYFPEPLNLNFTEAGKFNIR